jgi:hypothetical protein
MKAKKLLAVLVVLTLVIALAVPAFAADCISYKRNYYHQFPGRYNRSYFRCVPDFSALQQRLDLAKTNLCWRNKSLCCGK